MDVSTFLGVVTVFMTLLPVPSYVQGHGQHHTANRADGERPTGIHDPKVVHDTEHIKEHYEGKADFNETDMTPEELEFHYFKLHDFDNNTKLDGLEILKALTHLLPYEGERDSPPVEGQSVEDKLKKENDERLSYYTDIVDSVLEEDDMDNDGYLSYLEYVLARKREEARGSNYGKDKKTDSRKDRRH